MARPAKSADFVKVACKMPQGLDIQIPGRREHVRLHGLNSRYVVAGYGMTDVKIDLWTQVEALYEEAAWMTNGNVFAMPNAASARDKALDEHSDVKSGFEQIDPKKPNEARVGVAGTAGANVQIIDGPDAGMQG